MSSSREVSIVIKTVSPFRRLNCLSGLVLLLAVAFLQIAYAQPAKNRNSLQQVQDRHRDIYRDFSNQIEKLAKECDDKGLTEDAETIRARAFVLESKSLRAEKLPHDVRPVLAVVGPNDDRFWQSRLRHLEAKYAKDLYLQSKPALHQGFPGYAYDLIREAALHDPDNVQVRKILGFERLRNEWVTPFAASQMKKGFVWHEEFGWLPESYIAKYINDERYVNHRWVSTEKEKELRRDFNSAWEVRTDHYLIKTNVSLEKGVEMGKALEDFYRVFNETFAGFFNTPDQLKMLFDGSAKAGRPGTKPYYTVHFYRTREEYLERLRKFFPSIDQTNGVYMTSDKVAHFYYDPANNDHEGTLFHEATHQLFFESDPTNRTICENHHFWVIEGIACYMESFHRKNGVFTLGDPQYKRFHRARINLLDEKYYVPLRQFSGYGMQEFQGAAELAKNYTQAAGVSRFFMHYDNGRYREALVKHLAQLYSSNRQVREEAESLDTLTGVTFEDLDRQYAEDARALNR